MLKTRDRPSSATLSSYPCHGLFLAVSVSAMIVFGSVVRDCGLQGCPLAVVWVTIPDTVEPRILEPLLCFCVRACQAQLVLGGN